MEDKPGPKETNFLKLDCSKIKKDLGWKPRWRVYEEKKIRIDKEEINPGILAYTKPMNCIESAIEVGGFNGEILDEYDFQEE